MDLDSSDKVTQNIDISGETGDVTIIGKIVLHVTQFIDERILRRLGWEMRVGYFLLIVVVIGAMFFLHQTLQPRLPNRMTGDFRIAVAGFSEKGRSGDSEIGTELAQGVYLQLEQTFNELEPGFKVEIWRPDQVDETVKGQDHNERAKSAAQIAERIGADVLIYGWVDTTTVVWQVTPEFYVSADNFYEAEEVTGQHNLGAPFSVMGQGNIATRREISGELASRAQVLARITVGLAYYSVRDFETALLFFQSVGEIQEWDDDDGKEVLYLLIGNAAGRIDDLELAKKNHQKAISLDPEYARAYIGLASVYYISALKPYKETGSPTKMDLELMNLAITTYKQAAQAAHQPPLSDISVKVHFGLGQCYFMLVYSGNEELFAPAIVEFEAVIEAYTDGENPRMLEMAAESYARLGLIYALSGHPNWAIENYQKAASLLNDNPERQALYEGRAQAISDEAQSQ